MSDDGSRAPAIGAGVGGAVMLLATAFIGYKLWRQCRKPHAPAGALDGAGARHAAEASAAPAPAPAPCAASPARKRIAPSELGRDASDGYIPGDAEHAVHFAEALASDLRGSSGAPVRSPDAARREGGDAACCGGRRHRLRSEPSLSRCAHMPPRRCSSALDGVEARGSRRSSARNPAPRPASEIEAEELSLFMRASAPAPVGGDGRAAAASRGAPGVPAATQHKQRTPTCGAA